MKLIKLKNGRECLPDGSMSFQVLTWFTTIVVKFPYVTSLHLSSPTILPINVSMRMSALRKNPGFSIGRVSKTRNFRSNADNLIEGVRIVPKNLAFSNSSYGLTQLFLRCGPDHCFTLDRDFLKES